MRLEGRSDPESLRYDDRGNVPDVEVTVILFHYGHLFCPEVLLVEHWLISEFLRRPGLLSRSLPTGDK